MQLSALSWKASANATIRTLRAECRTLSIAPVPRPPQPIRPTLISSSPAAYRLDGTKFAASAAPAAATVEVLIKSRRVGCEFAMLRVLRWVGGGLGFLT